jgi:hypothetical protein
MKSWVGFRVATIAVFALFTAGACSASAQAAGGVRRTRGYGDLPLAFESNRGQANARVRFISRGRDRSLFLTSSEAVLALHHGSAPERAAAPSRSRRKAESSAVLRMKFVGANSSVEPSGSDELPGKSNYFIGNDPKQWHADVPLYSKVVYRNIYPGIDLVFYGAQGRLEYDYIVSPGADLRRIRFDLSGARKILRASNGDLLVRIADAVPEGTADGVADREVRWHKPHVYQEENGKRREIAGNYVIERSGRIGFRVAAYDARRNLVIDPVLSYSTYLGGNNDDQANAIAVDSAGNAYVTGYSYSTNFPTTSGVVQSTVANVFITKINPGGSALVYSTYLGGSAVDEGYGIAVDAAGDAYVAGAANSSNFPTTPNALQPSCGGSPQCSPNAFLTKLNPTGSALLYSSYLGGSFCFAYGISLDGSGNAYLTGYATNSFPTTPGAYSTVFNGGSYDGFVAKMNPSLSGSPSLVYSTYLGGNSEDALFSIATDAAGDAFVSGWTSSPNYPTTPGAFSTTYNGSSDYFVTKLDPTGSTLLYSTFFGGYSQNYPSGLAVDSAGNAYIAGVTYGNIPTTPGAFQNYNGGANYNAFAAKFNPSGTALVYSTYLDGSFGEGSFGLAVDSSGDAYVTGYTNSSDFPTLNSLQPAICNVNSNPYACPDVFVTELNPQGSGLVYSTYLGGSGGEIGTAIALDAAGNAYVTGHTNSTDFPTTTGAFSRVESGGYDAFVAKIGPQPVALSPSTLVFPVQLVGTSSAAQNLTLSNSGSAALTISAISTVGNFAQTNNCGTSVAGGSSCNIAVTFTPSAKNARTGSLTVTEDSNPTQLTAALNGTGTVVSLSTNALNFGGQTVGTKGPPLRVMLTNKGSVSLSISHILIQGSDEADFFQTNNCGGSVNANRSCVINVTFAPSTTGTRTATLAIAGNGGGSPQGVLLSGIGD